MPFNPVQPSSSNNANNTQINKLAADVRGSKVTQVFKDSTDRRVLLGKGKDDFYGLKVSQPGVDVYTATNDQLVFNSDNNLFKIIDSGELDLLVTNPSTSESVSYYHNLGYTPAVIAYQYQTVNGFANLLPYFDVNGAGSGTFLNFQRAITMTVDDERIIVYYDAASPQSTKTYYIKYYILQETAFDE